MGKSKITSQKQREAALNDFRNKKAIDAAYDMGHRNGFYNCLTIMMYSIMESTNYKHNGLMKIWNKTLDITEALHMPGLELTHEDIVLALAEEAGIVVDETEVKKARRAKGKAEHQKIVEEVMERYTAIIEKRNKDMGEN
ncbi:MAG: hypothetical protein IIV02_00610 [Peptococcaceae bacterium]|nr:hypothetical protein [Peptococcaceae bacterium]MBQ5658012.1 hypothetical protein [Peptococcaceae bacterium]